MKESVTYQAILEEGKLEEARKILLILGRQRFGEPTADILAAVDALADVRQCEVVTERVLQAANWQDLLGPNCTSRRGRGRKKTS